MLDPRSNLFRAGSDPCSLAGLSNNAGSYFASLGGTCEGSGDYKFVDSATRVAIVHKPSNTRLRVVGSNARTTFGLLDVSYAVWDEVSAAELAGGQLMWEALKTSLGKPGLLH